MKKNLELFRLNANFGAKDNAEHQKFVLPERHKAISIIIFVSHYSD